MIAVVQDGATSAKSMWEAYGPLIAAGSALLGVLFANVANAPPAENS